MSSYSKGGGTRREIFFARTRQRRRMKTIVVAAILGIMVAFVAVWVAETVKKFLAPRNLPAHSHAQEIPSGV